MAYTKYNTEEVFLYTYSSRHNFYGNFYYDSYRDGVDTYYRLKAELILVPASGYSIYYNNPINAEFKVKTRDAGTVQIKPSTSGTMFSNRTTWVAESEWESTTQKTGTIAATVRIYDTLNSSWIDYTYSMKLPTIPAVSTIGTVSNFNLESKFTVPVTKSSSSYTDILEIKYGNTTIKKIENYINGDIISLNTSELLLAYNALGSGVSGNFTINLTTKDGSTVIGTTNKTATGIIKGTAKIKKDGVWKTGIPFVKVNGVWKKTIAFIKVDGVWKRGNP